jgi:PAS domain S-box-containing protein
MTINHNKQQKPQISETSILKDNLESFFNSIKDFLFVLDANAHIRHVNATVLDRLGYTMDELIGQSVLMVYPEKQHDIAAKVVSAMINEHEEYCHLSLQTKEGQLISVETRGSRGQWDGFFAFFFVSKDITPLKMSEEKFFCVFENSATLMAISTVENGQFIEINRSFTEATGYTRKEAIGKTSIDLNLFFVPEQRNKIKEIFENKGLVRDVAVDMRTKHGDILKGLFSANQIHMDGRKCWLTVMTDITQLKNAEKSLIKLNEIQRSLITLAKHFINVPIDKQNEAIDLALATIGQVIQVDHANLFTYDFKSQTMSNTNEWCAHDVAPERKNLQQMPLSWFPEWLNFHQRGELIHIPSVEKLPESHLKNFLNEHLIKSIVSLPLMHGKECTGFVAFDAVHQSRCFKKEEIDLLWVLTELFANFELRYQTEQKLSLLNKKQKELLNNAQRSSRAKGMFIANMSHEIRTPLNAILGYAQIMDRECGDCHHKKKGLSAITKSGEHLLELINDILETIKADVQQIKISCATFDIKNMIQELTSMFAHRPDARDISISANISNNFPRYIDSDKGKIRQILLNLIGNAVKFTEKGIIDISADVQLSQSTETSLKNQMMLCISIKDTGYGIVKDQQELIFDIFEQSDSGHKISRGTGLGLPLSRRYARALGGDVTVTSQLSAGSTFTFTFKASVVLKSNPPKQECDIIKVINSVPKLLIVDDDLFNREMLKTMLSDVGFDVITSDSGLNALEKIKIIPFDAILLDQCMPDMDGIETLHHIRNLPNGKYLPVIIVTASGDMNDELVKREGANAFIAKPLTRSILLNTIKETIDVVYEYKNDHKINNEHSELSLSKKIHHLSSKNKNNILSGVYNGDIQLLRQTMDVIEKQDRDLSISLRKYVDSYDYDGLLRLIQ